MFHGTILYVPRSEAIRYAARVLEAQGLCLTEKCAPDVTHLLLPVPSFSGGDGYLAHLLAKLPEDVMIFGGNLNSPLVAGYPTVDFLKDPYYLADNAAITARCAIQMLKDRITDFSGKTALIIGWGRIGKCLGPLLKDLGIQVTIAARKIPDLAMIHALGYQPLEIQTAAPELLHFDMILNTVPELLFPDAQVADDAIVLELASKPGITTPKVIDARGLPGKLAPVESGKLIAETFIRLSL